MGFGFNLFCAFLLLPSTLLLIAAWGITRKDIFVKTVGFIWGSLLLLLILFGIIGIIGPGQANKGLSREDYNGEYIIARNYFPGKQADWQYESFRFVISADNKINFYVMQQGKEEQVFRGAISTVKPTNSERLVLYMEQPTYHILATDPTTYRNSSGFYVVFNSPKFGNVFFKKGEWKPLSK